jgi:hypothetical protein
MMKSSLSCALFFEDRFFTPAEMQRHHSKVTAVPTLLCALLAVSLVQAEDLRQPPAQFEAAKKLYYEAVVGDGGALKRASEIFESMHGEMPRDPLIAAYFGSTRLLQASKTLAVWKKGKLSQQGLELVDRAVGIAPENLEVRFVRAASTFHLPGFFNRKDQSRADFEWLSARVKHAAGVGTLDRRLAAAALYHHGLFREDAGDRSGARQAWSDAVRISADSRAGRDAKSKLDKLR